MKRSIDLDDDLAAEIDSQAPRPKGYFADACQDSSRAKLADAITKATVQRPER